MAPAQLSVKRLITTAIKRFKFEELESLVMPHFPEVSWNEIRSTLVNHHENFTLANVLRIIEHTINVKKISEAELLQRLTSLEVIEVSRHSRKKIWYGYELKKKKAGTAPITPEKLRHRIIQIFHTFKINVEVKIAIHEGITFVSIREKKRKLLMPSFFALFLEQGYYFSSRRAITKEFLHVITESVDYNEYKKLKLMGRHLKSLMKMLQMKNCGIGNIEKLSKSLTYKETRPIMKYTGVDFRQNKQRKEYIDKIFGDEPPTLNSLVVENTQSSWADKEIASILSDMRIDMSWEFRSPNIFEFLGQLAEKRVLNNPLPNYVTKLIESGTNELKIQNT